MDLSFWSMEVRTLTPADLHLKNKGNVGTLLSETDASGTILFANKRFCQVSQYSIWELVGQRHSIVRHPEMPDELFDAMWRTLTADNVFRGILKNRAKDGSHFWVHLTIVPTHGHRAEEVKFIGSGYHLNDDAEAYALYDAQMKLLESQNL